MDISCLIPANPDVAGVGVRLSIYSQNILGFVPAIAALLDFRITTYEMESIEAQAMTNLILAFAILISCGVQALTLGLSSYHASIVLSMSWINNTNAFIYFVLYVHYKAKLNEGPGLTPVKPEWRAWRAHVVTQLRAFLHLADGSGSEASGEESAEGSKDRQVKKSSAKILFGRIALFMGSLHLTLMAALGIWLWSNIQSFGSSTSSCATNYLSITILGAHVPFTSNPLRVTSLVIYGLFLLPAFNLILPMTLFLGFVIWHHSRYGTVAPKSSISAMSNPPPLPSLRPLSSQRSFTKPIIDVYTACIRSSIFPVGVGLAFLFAVNIIFIADIELTLRQNKDLQAAGETEWGFGQVLAVLLLVMPLRDLIEMILARRQRRQENQIKQLQWNRAILRDDIDQILNMVKGGIDSNVKADDGRTALEIVCFARRWGDLKTLLDAKADVNIAFSDCRTALELACIARSWDTVRSLVKAQANINARFSAPDKRTALEVACVAEDWDGVRQLRSLKADLTTEFTDGRTTLEVACTAQQWDIVRVLTESKMDINSHFSDSRTALEVASTAHDWEGVELLLELKADPNTLFTDGRTALELASSSPQWDIVHILVESKVNINTQFSDGRTVLHAAVSEGQWDLVPILVNRDTDLTSKPPDGNSALELAVCEKKWDTVNCLVEATDQTVLEVLIFARSWEVAQGLLNKGDVNVNVSFRDGRTAFEVASYAWQWTLVHALVKLGAEISRVLVPDGTSLDVWARHPDRAPGIHYLFLNDTSTGIQLSDDLPLLAMFAQARDWESVLDLVASKFDLNETFGDGHTALGAVILAKEWDGLQVLLDAGADVNKHFRHEGYTDTPLRVAYAEGAPVSVLELMLKKGADPNAQDGRDYEAFVHQTLKLYFIVPDTDGCGATLDSDEWTPLHYACTNGHAKCAQILLEAGADINARTLWNYTALHWACCDGRVNCVKLLLKRGADTSIKGTSTFLVIVTLNELFNLCASIADDRGRTAFQMASERNHSEVVELFRSYGVTE
ncbi:hypothetical protein NMY22_g17439 [Coprinellus aureogranulatus]|nr:hypothetical protein NMY22_g17439 [Coprinellus aureogranulatus]